MQTILLKLQADVESRKFRRLALLPVLRSMAVGGVLFFVAFQLGAHSSAAAAADSFDAYGDAPPAGTAGEGDYRQMQLERLQRVYHNSTHYRIPADLAAAIEDIALAERINPKLAFELVRTESRFNAHAISKVGALGYTQLMPATARLLSPGLSREKMFDRETNLRLGFRFLHGLLNHYDGDVKLALLAYNRGPDRVDRLLSMGIDPSNGYVQMVLGR